MAQLQAETPTSPFDEPYYAENPGSAFFWSSGLLFYTDFRDCDRALLSFHG
jgi:hypothetical protein